MSEARAASLQLGSADGPFAASLRPPALLLAPTLLPSGWYLRLNEGLIQVQCHKVLHGIGDLISPQTPQNQQLLKGIKPSIPLLGQGLSAKQLDIFFWGGMHQILQLLKKHPSYLQEAMGFYEDQGPASQLAEVVVHSFETISGQTRATAASGLCRGQATGPETQTPARPAQASSTLQETRQCLVFSLVWHYEWSWLDQLLVFS